MNRQEIRLDSEGLWLLGEIENGELVNKPLSSDEKAVYQNYANYTKSLQEKRQTTIRFSVSDLAAVKAKSKELGIGYQNSSRRLCTTTLLAR